MNSVPLHIRHNRFARLAATTLTILVPWSFIDSSWLLAPTNREGVGAIVISMILWEIFVLSMGGLVAPKHGSRRRFVTTLIGATAMFTALGTIASLQMCASRLPEGAMMLVLASLTAHPLSRLLARLGCFTSPLIFLLSSIALAVGSGLTMGIVVTEGFLLSALFSVLAIEGPSVAGAALQLNRRTLASLLFLIGPVLLGGIAAVGILPPSFLLIVIAYAASAPLLTAIRQDTSRANDLLRRWHIRWLFWVGLAFIGAGYGGNPHNFRPFLQQQGLSP